MRRAPEVLTSRKAQPDAQTRAGLRTICQLDVYAMARHVLGYTDLTQSFHMPVCERLQTTPYDRNLWLLPRGHLKTSIITIARNVQRIIQNPEVRILIGSNKAENADAMLAEIKGHLTNPKLVWMFPDVLYMDPSKDAEKWSTGAIITRRKRKSKEATIETIGLEGELTSKHYDHATFDDLVGLENSQTRDQLLATISRWQAAQSLLDPGATQDIVGTMWAHGDLYMWLIEQKRKNGMQIGVYRTPCWQTADELGTLILDERGNLAADRFLTDTDGKYLPAWPERFTYDYLESLKKPGGVGSVLFAAQYLLSPSDEETAVFPRSKAIVVRRDLIPAPENLWCVMAIDPAISTKSWADYSAVAVMGFDSHGKGYVIDLRRGKWAESKLVDQVYDAYQKTPNIRAIGCEAIGFQKIFRREFTRAGETRGYLPVIALERDTKIAKQTRIRALEPFWTNGELVLAADLQALDDFLEEAERWRPYKESLHDDMLDALADCLQLRVRPEEAPKEWLIDDPEAIERLEYEEALMRKHPGLDRASLRMSWGMALREKLWQEQREREILGAGTMNEFLG